MERPRLCSRSKTFCVFLGFCALGALQQLLLAHLVQWQREVPEPPPDASWFGSDAGISTLRKPPELDEFAWLAQIQSNGPIGFEGFIQSSDERPGGRSSPSLLQTMLKKQGKAFDLAKKAKEVVDDDQASVCLILTNFNNAEFLNRTFTDLLTQTFAGELGIVVVDDFSEDGSRSHITTWAAEDERIIPVLLPGRSMGGTGIPSNIGIEVCKRHTPPYTYIAFADGDDMVEAEFIQKMVTMAEEQQAEVVICDFDVGTRDGGSNSLIKKAASEQSAWKGLPKSTAFDPRQYLEFAALLMPAPWRKMARLDFMLEHNIRFPEGDFFYEDNVMHWLIIAQAKRVAIVPDVLVHHRASRTLFSNHMIRHAGFFSVANAIGMYVMQQIQTKEHEPIIGLHFLDFVDRLRWIITKQSDLKMRHKFAAWLPRLRNYWRSKLLVSLADGETDSKPPPALDLSIAIPTYNAAPFLPALFKKLLQLKRISFEVILIDGASTDGSSRLIADFAAGHQHAYNISLPYTSPAGVLRNLAMPLLEGTYTFFLDADDDFDPTALEAAVLSAMAAGSDVLMMPYQLAHVSEHEDKSEKTTFMGMDKNDLATWRNVSARVHSDFTRARALTLVNYPWNRIVRTQLIHENNIFFGTTLVQNDVQYHWHTLSVARKVAFLEHDSAPVTYHKKFVGSSRMQVTKVRSPKRLEMIWALQATHRVLANSGTTFCDDAPTMRIWYQFVRKVFTWAKNNKLIPKANLHQFRQGRDSTLKCASSCSLWCLYFKWMLQSGVDFDKGSRARFDTSGAGVTGLATAAVT